MDKKEFLGTQPVGRLFFKLSLPAVVAQLVNLLYNIVDRIYIGHMPEVGDVALTGVGVTMPIIMMISAFACLSGMGGAPRASILMGKKEHDTAERVLGNCFTFTLITSAVLTLFFSFFGSSLLPVFGASENTLSYSSAYLSVYVLGTVFVEIALGMNAFISAQGFTTVSMLSVVIGAAMNIALDPLFIFAFDMGVQGAALATVISQAASAAWVLIFLCGKRSLIRLRFKNMALKAKLLFPCIALGLSPFVMQITESALFVCFNSSLLKYGGDVAVGAMTILSTMMQFTMLPLQGLTQGAQPITSYNFGAGNMDRVKKSFSLLLRVCLIYSVTLWAAAELFPQVFASVFTDKQPLIEYTSRAMRVYMGAMLLFGAQIACQQTLIAIGNAKTSIFLACLRKLILLIPLIYILPNIFTADKAMSVYLAEPISDAVAVITTCILFFFTFRKAVRVDGAGSEKG